MLEFAQLSHFGNLQCDFSDIHFVQRHFAGDEKSAVEYAARDCPVGPLPTADALKSFRWDIVT